MVQSKNKGEGAEGLLPTRQVGNVLPAFLGRPYAEYDALQRQTSFETVVDNTHV